MSTPKPAWAGAIPTATYRRIRETPHSEYVFEHLNWSVEHPDQLLDVTFYDHEPILEVTLDRYWARELQATLMYDRGIVQLQRLLDHVVFSDGSSVPFNTIWTIIFIPPNLNTAGVDLSQGEDIAGFGGETIRHMIRETYRCKSRAEEDFFLARWIAA